MKATKRLGYFTVVIQASPLGWSNPTNRDVERGAFLSYALAVAWAREHVHVNYTIREYPAVGGVR